MVNKVLDIARYVINYANDKNTSISNLQLQKIIYYIQAAFLVEKNKKCFEEDILNWTYGPVVQEVYNEFRVYGNSPIEIQKNYLELELDKKTGRINFKTKLFNDDVINELDRELINKVVDAYSKKTPFELVKKTHSEAPWRNTKQNEVINTDSIRDFYAVETEKLYK